MSGERARLMETGEGIKILRGVVDAPGVKTLEGRFGPLLNARRGGAHYVEVPPGAYMDDHPHERESLIREPVQRGSFLLIFKVEDRTPGYDEPMLQRLEVRSPKTIQRRSSRGR